MTDWTARGIVAVYPDGVEYRLKGIARSHNEAAMLATEQGHQVGSVVLSDGAYRVLVAYNQ